MDRRIAIEISTRDFSFLFCFVLLLFYSYNLTNHAGCVCVCRETRAMRNSLSCGVRIFSRWYRNLCLSATHERALQSFWWTREEGFNVVLEFVTVPLLNTATCVYSYMLYRGTLFFFFFSGEVVSRCTRNISSNPPPPPPRTSFARQRESLSLSLLLARVKLTQWEIRCYLPCCWNFQPPTPNSPPVIPYHSRNGVCICLCKVLAAAVVVNIISPQYNRPIHVLACALYIDLSLSLSLCIM